LFGRLPYHTFVFLNETHQRILMPTLALRGEHITLAQAIKAAGLADSGGQAKHVVREGKVNVNDQVVTQPGRKLIAGDRFRVTDGDEWTVSQ
jgi:ribosome-associated protein